jgi:hypothetical protein
MGFSGLLAAFGFGLLLFVDASTRAYQLVIATPEA